MVMKREQVQSSAIQSIGYDEENAILEVRFNDGRTYNSTDAPLEMHLNFMNASSKGKFYNARIKKLYRLK